MSQSTLQTAIKDELLSRIKSGHYKEGEKFPTEYALCEEFDVSRTTVRGALNQLTMEGYLVRQQGRGTFVAGKKVQQTLSYTPNNYAAQLAVQGKRGQVALIDISVISASGQIASVFEAEDNAPIQKIERIRHADGEPTQYEVSFIPWQIAPGITKEQAEHSLFRTLAEVHDVHVAKTTEALEIALADEKVSALLDCPLGSPCFHIETVTEDESGRAIEYSRSYFRGDKTSFVIEREHN